MSALYLSADRCCQLQIRQLHAGSISVARNVLSSQPHEHTELDLFKVCSIRPRKLWRCQGLHSEGNSI